MSSNGSPGTPKNEYRAQRRRRRAEAAPPGAISWILIVGQSGNWRSSSKLRARHRGIDRYRVQRYWSRIRRPSRTKTVYFSHAGHLPGLPPRRASAKRRAERIRGGRAMARAFHTSSSQARWTDR